MPAELMALTERVRTRVVRWFLRRRLLDAAAAADMLAWENSCVFAPNHPLRPAVTAPAIRNLG
jgi:hypothetical protein